MTCTATEQRCVEKRKKQRLRNNEYYGDVQDTFDELYRQGKSDFIFNNLMPLITSEANILLAYRNIKKNKGSMTSATDGQTIEDVGKRQPQELIQYIQHKIRDYHPGIVRRVEIPKPDGRVRALGIPTIDDRMIQQCIKQILEPICESKFHNHSYGFRPNRSTHHAIARSMFLVNINKLHYVVDVDIKSFFEEVNHGKLLKQIWSLGIEDKNLLCILSKMLKAEVEKVGIPNRGTAQGGVLSPLLSNIVLNELDWWISDQWETFKPQKAYTRKGNKYKLKKHQSKLKEIFIVRYADDLKIFCRDKITAEKTFKAVKEWLKERLHLEISPEKSKITNLKNNYTDFLGIKLKAIKKGKKIVCKSHVRDKAIVNMIEKLKKCIKDIRQNPKAQIVNKMNSAILGMHNYYKCATYVNLDFSRISFLINRTLHNRLRAMSTKKGTKSKTFIKFYGKYNYKTSFISGVGLFPIGGVTTKPPMCFKQAICNYTEEGRSLIHDNLQSVSHHILKYLMENSIAGESSELNDNRISLYVSQDGKCGVSGERLELDTMEVHHKVPKEKNGTDEYSNLVYVKSSVHKLIHEVNPETIRKYLEQTKLDEKSLRKLNVLRKEAGNHIIE